MPEAPPPGVLPLFLRGSTAEKYGFKTGENVMDLVDHKLLSKEEVLKEITVMGVMSDFAVAKKEIEASPGDTLLFIVDKEQKYGEMMLLCYTEDSKAEFLHKAQEAAEALEAQLRAEQEAVEAAAAAAYARANVVYEDKPLSCRPWQTSTSVDTEQEIALTSKLVSREPISIQIRRLKRSTKMAYRFIDRNADVAGGLQEFRPVKDPNFVPIRESDLGLQCAPESTSSMTQTNWYRSVNKSCQYEPMEPFGQSMEHSSREKLCTFLENATVLIEMALQQNETIDIFNDTFKTTADDNTENVRDENELREIKNFADPNYSKAKRLSAIDWMPKMQGMVAVSAVRNISLDERSSLSGYVYTSHILLWDFRQLVRPYLLMQSAHEIYCFQFNKTNPGLVIGGSITGQVILWDISVYTSSSRRNMAVNTDEDDVTISPVLPKFISSVDYSHKRSVSDIFWLPATTQINFRGQLVSDEFLDGNSYQFVTISADACIMVWDIRFQEILLDEVKHIGRPRHIPVEKSASKDSPPKALWGPIFKAQLKRLDGVGELSLCRIAAIGGVKGESLFAGDARSQVVIADEEGDLIAADLCAAPKEVSSNKAEDDEEGHTETARDFIKWMVSDHSRPAVTLQQSPFLPGILLSVSDWNFHLWKVGSNKPFFVSPKSRSYLTCGAWSPTRSSVLFLSCSDGAILVWDFTDSSYKHSIELKATHTIISSMQFLVSNNPNSKQQLLAVGTNHGVLHVFEVPPSLARIVHKEEIIMQTFIDREFHRWASLGESEEFVGQEESPAHNVGSTEDNRPDSALQDVPVETKKVEDEKLKKAEDVFEKLESQFLAELGLSTGGS